MQVVSRRWLRRGSKWLGLTLMIILLLRLDIRDVGATFRTIDLHAFGLAVLLGVLLLYLKGLRWRLLLASAGTPISRTDATAIYAVGGCVGFFTPGQSGDLIKVWYLRDRGHPIASSVFVSLIDRLIDLGVTCVIALSGIFLTQTSTTVHYVAWLGLMMVCCLAVALRMLRYVPQLLSWLTTKRCLPQRYHAPIQTMNIHMLLLHLSVGQLLRLTALSLVILVCLLVRLYLVCASLGLLLPIGPFLVIIGVTTLAGLFSFAGLGTRDIAMVVLLHQFAVQGLITTITGDTIAPSQNGTLALALSTLFLLANILNAAVGGVVMLRYPLPLK